MDKPLVSVVMATFNEPACYITKSIESILNQSYSNLELLIADDSTRQETIDVIDNYAKKDNRIIVIRQQEKMGFVKALNEALKLVHGEFIARMDGDDISRKNRLELQVEYLQRFSNVDILGGAMDIINENEDIISFRNYPLGGIRLHCWSIMRNPLAHPTVMFRAFIPRSGLFYDTSQKKAEDLEFWLRLKKKGFTIKNLSEKLVYYRTGMEFVQRRGREQFLYSYRARKKNFIWRYPIFSILSLLFSYLYTITPDRIINMVYNRENSRNIEVH